MHGKHKMAGPDFLTSLVLIAFGTAVVIGAAKMRVIRMFIVSPGLFPMILGSIFILFGVIMFIISVKNGGARAAMHYFTPSYLREVIHSPRTYRGGVIFLLTLAYVLLFGNSHLAELNTHFTVGNEIIPLNFSFFLVTGGYLFVTFVYLKAMTTRSAAIVSLVSAVVIFYAFNKGFGIPIP